MVGPMDEKDECVRVSLHTAHSRCGEDAVELSLESWLYQLEESLAKRKARCLEVDSVGNAFVLQKLEHLLHVGEPSAEVRDSDSGVQGGRGAEPRAEQLANIAKHAKRVSWMRREMARSTGRPQRLARRCSARRRMARKTVSVRLRARSQRREQRSLGKRPDQRWGWA